MRCEHLWVLFEDSKNADRRHLQGLLLEGPFTRFITLYFVLLADRRHGCNSITVHALRLNILVLHAFSLGKNA